MATHEGNIDGIEAIEDGQDGNEANPRNNGEHDHVEGDGLEGGDGQHDENPGEDTEGEALRMLANMPENIKEAARLWGPQEFIQALSEGVELKKKRQRAKQNGDHSTEGEDTNPRRKAPSTTSEVEFGERSVPISEVLKIMREERRAERASCENQSRRSAIPPRPQTYDGLASGELFIEEFIFYIENSGPGNPHPSDFTNSFAAFLTDRAKIWYKRLSSKDQHNWDILLPLFRTDFVDHFREEARDAYKHRRQGAGETVEAYSNEMDRLLSTAGLPREEMLDVYITNLRSAIRRHVKSFSPKSIREAERLALEKEADIKESHIYFSPSDGPSADAEDHVLQRLLDRINSLATESVSPPQEPKKPSPSLEEDVLSKIMAKLQILQQKGKPAPRKHTVASLAAGAAAPSKRKNKGSKKKKGTAPQESTTDTGNQESTPTAAPVYPQMPYSYFPGPMMPPFQGPAFYPYPPPGYGNQVPRQTQNLSQAPASHSQNQGN